MINTKMGAFLLAAFIAGTFVSSPELRAYAANTVGSADIINNSILSADIKDGEVKTVDLGNDAVTSAKIKNGEVKTDDIAPSAIGSLRIKDNDVKAVDIAPDAVGASELQGVTNLTYASCLFRIDAEIDEGEILSHDCPVPGADIDDSVIVTKNAGDSCFDLAGSRVFIANNVRVILENECPFSVFFGTGIFSIIVFDK